MAPKPRRTAVTGAPAPLAHSPSHSPLPSEDEDALGPPPSIAVEDASGPPPVPVAADDIENPQAPAADLDQLANIPPEPAIIPAPSELSQVLAALAAQAQQMAALQSELRDQKAAAKAVAKEHEQEAHLRAMVARDEAQKGRLMPVGGTFASASSLFPDPSSPSTLGPAGVSRASQVDPSGAPPLTSAEKKRARAGQGGRDFTAPALTSTPAIPDGRRPGNSPGLRVEATGSTGLGASTTNPPWPSQAAMSTAPPRAIALPKPPTPPKKRATTPPLPPAVKQIDIDSSSSSEESCGERGPNPAPAPPAPKASASTSTQAADKDLKDVMSKGWTRERAREALDRTNADGPERVAEAVRYALNKWPAGPLDYLLAKEKERERAKAPTQANAVAALLAKHPQAQKTVLTCLDLHDRERGQHSSDPLIAASSIRTAAKQADKRASDNVYLEAAAAAIAVDCAACHALLEKKNSTAAEAAAIHAAKLLQMQKVVLPYPSSKGGYVPAPQGEDVTCDECGLGWSPQTTYVRLCEGCPRKFHDTCVRFIRARDLVPPATYIDPDNWICEDCQSKHEDRQLTADRVGRRKMDRDQDREHEQERRPPPSNQGRGYHQGGAAADDRRRPSDQHREGPPKRAYVSHNTASQYRVNSGYYSTSSFEEEQPLSGTGKKGNGPGDNERPPKLEGTEIRPKKQSGEINVNECG